MYVCVYAKNTLYSLKVGQKSGTPRETQTCALIYRDLATEKKMHYELYIFNWRYLSHREKERETGRDAGS